MRIATAEPPTASCWTDAEGRLFQVLANATHATTGEDMVLYMDPRTLAKFVTPLAEFATQFTRVEKRHE